MYSYDLRQVKNFDAKVFTFNDYGKETIKTFKMSPDAFIQQAVQLAYFRYIVSAFISC